MAEDINLTISNVSIKSIIESHVQTAVLAALRPHSEQFVRELVERSLLVKSKDDKYRYSNEDQKPTVLEHIVRTIIAEEATKAIREWAESNRSEVAKQIRKSITSAGFSSRWANQMVDSLVKAEEYRFSVNVSPIIEK